MSFLILRASPKQNIIHLHRIRMEATEGRMFQKLNKLNTNCLRRCTSQRELYEKIWFKWCVVFIITFWGSWICEITRVILHIHLARLQATRMWSVQKCSNQSASFEEIERGAWFRCDDSKKRLLACKQWWPLKRLAWMTFLLSMGFVKSLI